MPRLERDDGPLNVPRVGRHRWSGSGGHAYRYLGPDRRRAATLSARPPLGFSRECVFSVGRRPCHPPRRKWASAAYVFPAGNRSLAMGGPAPYRAITAGRAVQCDSSVIEHTPTPNSTDHPPPLRSPRHHRPSYEQPSFAPRPPVRGASCFPEEFAVPTYETLPRFTTDLNRLTPEQRRCFRHAVKAFVHDLRTGGRFRAGLREARRFAESGRGLTGNSSASLCFRRRRSGFRQLVDAACQ